MAGEASEATATRLLGRIEATFRGLLTFPLGNPARDQLARGLRVAFNGNYAIYYMCGESEVLIVRVLHGARDAVAIAERGGFLAG